MKKKNNLKIKYNLCLSKSLAQKFFMFINKVYVPKSRGTLLLQNILSRGNCGNTG